MELKDFITQTLTQITDGIRAGHKYIKENNYGDGVADGKGKEISFDIAVGSNDDKTTGMSGKISVANVFGVGGKDESTSKTSNLSRIQFKLILFVKAGD